MFPRRENAPSYELLNDVISQTQNFYGGSIETVKPKDALRDVSLNINNDAEIGENPDRYKQHGFYFNADNCIACHACEAACSEKNNNPAHISFRSVGFVEGGTYPDYQRLNISMACNHCDDPVCLKGCPTRAYTKFAEYGAVLQDPDICFGCGYCTWVCPYNAPQLDPVKGEVTKCNMCVDRLEVGLKPACVAACLGNALDFGVIENIPEKRSQAKLDIPGFPRTDITRPNIRFEQKRTPQRDMMRVDSTAIKYHRDDETKTFQPVLDPKHGFQREWNLKKLLGSHENAHIAFTLSVQAVMGAFLILMAGLWVMQSAVFESAIAVKVILVAMVALVSFGLFKLNMHLGKPHRFYRGFYNLKHSPVSREIAGVSLFYTGLLGYTALAFIELSVLPILNVLQHVFAVVAILGAALGGYYMYKLYRIEARPFWNHWYTGASFSATALIFGALLIAIISPLFNALNPVLNQLLLFCIGAGLLLEITGLLAHAKSLKSVRSEGVASFYEQTTTYGKGYWLRNGLLLVALLLVGSLLYFSSSNPWVYGMLFVATLAAAILGRALFYVVVIPTTMPGAFFWKNQGFVDHARETGLAKMPQVGVVYERHHAFDVGALIKTIVSTSMKEKFGQLYRVITG
ncbi:MAG: dimethyl sulfoxide reductase anchor subunit [Gammaproteobacteria bacterium]|nr:dimethyl sulfoxide reductase anchor subunit [Gammaproteobacteria bacterium]